MRLQRFKPNKVINLNTVPTHIKHTENKHISQNKHTLFALTKMCLFWEGEDSEKIRTFSQNKHISKNKHTFLAARKCAYYECAHYRFFLVNKHDES